MSETGKHTPGPWTFDHDWHRLPTIFGADRYKVAIIEKDKPTAERVANARLIAAAPDMLAALIEIERLCGCPKPNLVHIKTIAARERAKATGTP